MNSTTREAVISATPSENGYVNLPEHSIRVTYWSQSGSQEHVIMVPPLDEEMHLARRYLAEMGRRLAKNGINVLLYDPPGMGESISVSEPPDFSSHAEVLGQLIHALSSTPQDNVSLVSLRSGFLTTLDLELGGKRVKRHIACEPITNGGEYIRLQLRQKVMAQKLQNQPVEDVVDLEQRLRDGHSVDVGGYQLTSAFYQQLSSIEFNNATTKPAENCYGLFSQEPNMAKLGEHWFYTTRVISGNRFWAIEDGDAQAMGDELVNICHGQ